MAIKASRVRLGDLSVGFTQALADALRAEHDVLIVPGSHFDLDYYLRLGIGGESAPLREGLERLTTALTTTPVDGETQR